MGSEAKITLPEWNELTNKEKEIVRIWTVNHGYELDLVPGSAGSFELACDYAALLTQTQVSLFLQEHNQKVQTNKNNPENCTQLWIQVQKFLRKETKNSILIPQQS